MRDFRRLFSSFFKVALRREMAYRGTFIAGIIGQWISYGATFLGIYIMVSSFDILGGWNGSEVLMLYGLSVMSYAIGASFFCNFSNGLAGRIRSGEFDASLTKPIHPFLHEVFSAGYNVGYISHFTVSLVIMVIALSHTDFIPTVPSLLFLLSAVLGASLVQAAALIASSTMSFFTVGNNPIADFLLWDVKEFTNYPITVFPKGIQFVLTFILPFAFMNFYPAAALLGKSIPEGYPAILPYLSPLVGALVFALSILLWNWGLKHYKSTGS
ncbi:ABC transporter permease [Acutalibacter muris]|jgi:ABC-2 type transport system permease protein|uniref:ABC transporter permease n=1 Tax=Acutalibacter muris TaxID=1796620 RepID=UPI0026F38B66|nr:ABC-2 family transporter protein [Acutalibacter muris]